VKAASKVSRLQRYTTAQTESEEFLYEQRALASLRTFIATEGDNQDRLLASYHTFGWQKKQT
jgi:hypothetical protein